MKKIMLLAISLFILYPSCTDAQQEINETEPEEEQTDNQPEEETEQQPDNSEELLSMSQCFDMMGSTHYDLPIATYSHPNEYTLRRGVPNFIAKCNAGKTVTVAYLGGSITRTDTQYRLQSANYLATIFPNATMIGLNAGIGGTGAELGACRLEENVLRFNPDLVFVEFAVNGAHAEGCEGIVRQIIEHNPSTEICFVYTVASYNYTYYNTAGGVPPQVERLENVAAHYNIPSIHMGLIPAQLVAEGKCKWQESELTSDNEIAITTDGTHPTLDGGNFYASAIARAFNELRLNVSSNDLTLPTTLLANQMERGKMISPATLDASQKGWNVIETATETTYSQYTEWFEQIYAGDTDSQPLSFTFEGNMLGVFDIGDLSGGDIDIVVDGKKLVATVYNPFYFVNQSAYFPLTETTTSLRRFTEFCTTSRMQYALFTIEEGVHEVSISVSTLPIDKQTILEMSSSDFARVESECQQQIVRLGRILINGDIVE